MNVCYSCQAPGIREMVSAHVPDQEFYSCDKHWCHLASQVNHAWGQTTQGTLAWEQNNKDIHWHSIGLATTEHVEHTVRHRYICE